MEGTRKRGGSCERRRDEVKEDLKITRIKNRKAIAETIKNGWRQNWKRRCIRNCSD
jgi:hypothetical protein